MRKFLFVLIILSFQVFVYAQNGTEPVKVTDLLKVKTLGTLNLSTDGSLALFTVLSIEPEAESKLDFKYNTQIWIVPADGSAAPRQLTTAKESASQAVFSPDGKQIVFVRAVEGKSQLFLLGLEGGEALQLTKSKYGASNPKWSPDGKQLLFSSGISFKDLLNDSLLNPGKAVPVWSLEKPGLDNTAVLKNAAKGDPDGSMEEVRAYLEKNAEDRKAKVITKLNHLDEMDVNGEMNFTHYFIMEATTGCQSG